MTTLRLGGRRLEQALQSAIIGIMGAETRRELFCGELVALRADLFQHIGGAQRSDFARQFERRAIHHSKDQAGTIGIADARRVFDRIDWKDRHFGHRPMLVNMRPVLALGNNQDLNLIAQLVNR